MQNTAQVWNYLKGKKTYVGVVVGLIIVWAHKEGIPIPGNPPIDDSEVMATTYKLLMAAAFRHGVG